MCVHMLYLELEAYMITGWLSQILLPLARVVGVLYVCTHDRLFRKYHSGSTDANYSLACVELYSV